MPYDELLAIRVRAAISPLPGLKEKKMFGGVCYLVRFKGICRVLWVGFGAGGGMGVCLLWW